jgi:hypothetical protein
MQFGVLRIWLFAPSPEDATARAIAIVAELPYERVGDQVAVEIRRPSGVATDVPSRQSGPSQQACEQINLREELALESGLALMLIVVPTGGDEAGFETMPLSYE